MQIPAQQEIDSLNENLIDKGVNGNKLQPCSDEPRSFTILRSENK